MPRKKTAVKPSKRRPRALSGPPTAPPRDFHVPVAEIEFTEGNNTLWVHGSQGGTVLRVKCTGKIRVDDRCNSPIPHADMMVQGDIVICLPVLRGFDAVKVGEKWKWVVDGTVFEVLSLFTDSLSLRSNRHKVRRHGEKRDAVMSRAEFEDGQWVKVES